MSLLSLPAHLCSGCCAARAKASRNLACVVLHFSEGRIESFRLLVRLFEKRSYYVLLSLDFPPLSAQFGAVLLEIGVGLFAHADGRPVFAFHLQFIHFITDKYLWAPTMSGDES